MRFLSAIAFACLALSNSAIAEILADPTALKVAPHFGSSAVLQQGMPIPIWGEAMPGCKITVSFDEQEVSTKADANGHWKVTLKAMEADKLDDLSVKPKGRAMKVGASLGEAYRSVVNHNILIGEVWLCAGQSNMAGKVKNNTMDPKDDLSKLKLPTIRQYRADTGWHSATEGEVREFTKVGLTFARKLQQHLKVPVGLLNATRGGSSIEAWMRPDEKQDPEAKRKIGGLYTSNLQPLIGTAIKGALWYQGEANVKDGFGYYDKLDTLIGAWREEWDQGDFPFHIVQLAGIGKSDPNLPEMGDGRAAIRDAQFQAMKQLPNVGLATAIEIGGPKEHPPNKTDIGKRLAHWALRHQYDKNVTASGPIYLGYERRCSTMAIQFENGKGLSFADKEEGYGAPTVSPDGTELPWVSIQDPEGVWHWATAWVEGDELLVHNPDVENPVAVRYAWTNRPTGPYLYNKAGLPAFPFTTEQWATLHQARSEAGN